VDFGHYTDESVSLAVDLVNSVGSISGREYLGTPQAVRRFLRAHDVRVPTEISARDVEELHDVRQRLRAVFESSNDDEAKSRINSLLRDAGPVPEISDHDGRWHLHYVSRDEPLAHRVAGIAAMALATVVSEFGRERLGVCSAGDCLDVFVDTSRNLSRRYCDDACSTRTNVAAFRARHRSG
jgi:predicted RNA-binding Zn ribbon-like protein